MSNRRSLLFVLAIAILFIPKNVMGQFFTAGDDPGSAKWRQIKTQNYIFIYPQEIDSLARKYATLFETNRARVMEPLGLNPKKIPVVFHPYYTRSNGVVTWAPKRVDIFTTPPAYANTSEPWAENVSIHESRHIGQVSHFENGVYNVLYYLLGEQSTGIGVGLYPSKAFLEGDAVIAETELTNAGRGRNADFLQYLRAAYLNDDFRDWDRWNFGSYKYFTPDHYAIGYVINSTLRYHAKDYKYPGKLLDYMVKHFYNPSVIFNSFNSVSGRTKQKLLEEGQQILTEIWKEDLNNIGQTTEGEDLKKKPERLYTDYRYPVFIDDTTSKYHGHIIAVKDGFERASSLVAVDQNGKERHIRPFGNYTSPLTVSKDGNIYWSESVFNGPNQLKDQSIIGSFNLRTGKMSFQQFGTRYFNPTASPKGDRIAVAEYPVEGSSYLVLLTSGQQHLIGKVEAPGKGQIKEIAFIGETIYCSVVLDKGLGVYKFDGETWEEVIPQQNQTLVGMKSSGKYLYFTSDLSGVNNIYAFDTEENNLYKLTNALYGASDGFIQEDTMFYSEFDLQGYHLAKNDLKSLKWEKSDFTKPYKYPIAEMLSEQAKEQTSVKEAEVVDVTDKLAYPSKRYSKLGNLFRIHSWGPIYYNIDNIKSMSYENIYDLASLGATVYSQNSLGTAVSMLGYSYHKGFHSAHAKFSYTGWAPAIEIAANFNDRNRRSMKVEKGSDGYYHVNTTEHLHSPFLHAYALIYYPWNMSRGGWNRGFIPQFQWNFTNDRYYSVQKNKYVYKHQLNYGVKYYQTLPVTGSGFYPRWGFGISLMGGSAPGTGENFGNMVYLNGYFYFPGITPQQGLKLTATVQKQNVEGKVYYLSSYATLPRGYKDMTPTENYAQATLDYAIPIYLGDYNLWTLLYFKRLTLIPFVDYAIDVVPDYKQSIYWSAGSDLMVDIYPLRFNVPVSIGVRYAYTGPQSGNRNHVQFLFSLKLP